MSPEVLARKLGRLERYLNDLAGHRGRSPEEVAADPYAVERLLELVVQVAVDILSHLLADRGLIPESYRATFELAGVHGLVDEALARRLARAAGLRNILVHLYEDIDYEIVAASIDAALQDFGMLLEKLKTDLLESP